MKKMTQAQWRAVRGVDGRGMATGRENTMRSLEQNGYAYGRFGRWAHVTRAGLIAAGVDMDAIHAEALAEYRRSLSGPSPDEHVASAQVEAWMARYPAGWTFAEALAADHMEALSEDYWRNHPLTAGECIQHSLPLNAVAWSRLGLLASGEIDRAHDEALEEAARRTAWIREWDSWGALAAAFREQRERRAAFAEAVRAEQSEARDVAESEAPDWPEVLEYIEVVRSAIGMRTTLRQVLGWRLDRIEAAARAAMRQALR